MGKGVEFSVQGKTNPCQLYRANTQDGDNVYMYVCMYIGTYHRKSVTYLINHLARLAQYIGPNSTKQKMCERERKTECPATNRIFGGHSFIHHGRPPQSLVVEGGQGKGVKDGDGSQGP